MDRASFLAKHTLGAGNVHTAELLDYLTGLGMTVSEIDRQIRIPQAANITGPLKGTTVKAAFLRASILDEYAKAAWAEEQQKRAWAADRAMIASMEMDGLL